MQRGSADIWKKNDKKDLERELWNYEVIGKFSENSEKKFREWDNKIIKVAKLKRMEQESKIMEEFVQKFRRAARGSRDCWLRSSNIR